MQELVDIEAVSELAHAAGATVVVDNRDDIPVLTACNCGYSRGTQGVHVIGSRERALQNTAEHSVDADIT